MKKEEAVACLGIGAITIISISSLMAPRECRAIQRQDAVTGWCAAADRTAGMIAGTGSLVLIGMGAVALVKKQQTEPTAIKQANVPLLSNYQTSHQITDQQEPGYVEGSDRSHDELIQPTGFEGQKQVLWEKLHSPEYEWLLQLLLTKPLLVWGEQCSGKTKFSGFLAMLRMLFFSHQVSVADPHAHQNRWPHIFEIYGGEYNYGQVNNRLAAYYQRLKNGSMPHTSIWDEVTNYAENCDEKLAGRFLKSILSDVRKPPEFPILLSHSNTLNSLGGGKGGVKQMQIRGLVEVNLRAKRDRFGNLKPALKGAITGLKVDENNQPIVQQIELEPWMQPEWLMSEFPDLGTKTSTKKATNAEQLETAWVNNEKQQVLRLVEEGLTQTEIIQTVWGVKPGESSRYYDAVNKFKTYSQEV